MPLGLAARQGRDLVERRLTGIGQDEIGNACEISELELDHHVDQAAMADLVAGRQRIDVADELVGLADIAADDHDQRLVDRAAVGELHDRDMEPFLVDRVGVGAEAAPADIDDVGRAGEEADMPPPME